MRRIVKLLAAAAIALSAVCSTGCVSIGESYPNADKYTAGNREFKGDKVRALDINWRSGKVTVSRHDKDTIAVEESSDKDLKEEEEVRTWLDGEVLRVQFCKSGEPYFFKQPEKELEIKIPADMELTRLDYAGSSGDAIIENITAETFCVETSSGGAKLLDCSGRKISAEASSGNVTIKQKGEAESISAAASSGNVHITAEKAGEIDAECASGNIEISADEAGEVKAEIASGNAELRFAVLPSLVRVEAASGDVKLYVPEGAGFTADVDTASGDFDSDIPLVKDGGSYVSGDGSGKIKITTASGDVRITN